MVWRFENRTRGRHTFRPLRWAAISHFNMILRHDDGAKERDRSLGLDSG